VTPAKITTLTFDSAFFMGFRRCAKVALEAPVRAEGDEACRLLALMAAQDLLHRTLQVVVSEKPKNSTKIVEGLLMGLEKRLLRRTLICPMEGCAAHHAA
jgi:hypothetical protein